MPKVRVHNFSISLDGFVAGPWPDQAWRGWWGEEPPSHHPVFVLTHHERAPAPMAGGTTFHFVTGGIEAALDRALEAARGLDVRIGGGAYTVRQHLRADLIDELHLAVVPVLLGAGERSFEDPGGRFPDRYESVELEGTDNAAHALVRRRT